MCIFVFFFTLLALLPMSISYSFEMLKPGLCSLSMTSGTNIPKMGTAFSSTSRFVQISRNGTFLSSNGEYVAGESLTVSLSSTNGEYVFEATNATFSGNNVGCSGKRTTADGQTLTMPNDGSTVFVLAGFALMQSGPGITSTFTLKPPSGLAV
jgi:hypothetical protein